MKTLQAKIEALYAPFNFVIETDVDTRLEVNGRVIDDACLTFDRDGTARVIVGDVEVVSRFPEESVLEVIERRGSVRIALVEGTVVELFASLRRMAA